MVKCPRCAKEGKKVIMETDVINYEYKCPKCKKIIKWIKK